VPLLGGDRWESTALEKEGLALEGSYYSSSWSPGDPSPRTQEFIARYRARFGETPDALAAAGYDATMVAADAMSRARDLSGGAVAAALAETAGFPGVTGTITLDAEHNAVKPAAVLEVKGGKAVYVATVKPDEPAGAAAFAPGSPPAR
jgi:branched-chain amino acid transport system substrate-binding protein